MKKYDLLITLIIGSDVGRYINYYENEDDKMMGATISLNSLVEGYDSFYFRISFEGNKYKAFVDDVEDDDFEQAELKELMNLLKEKYEAKQETIKINAWKKLGLY